LTVAPDKPALDKPPSLNTVLASGLRQGREVPAGVWSAVDTRALSIRSLCNGYLQHIKSFIYGRFGNGANLTLCETDLNPQLALTSIRAMILDCRNTPTILGMIASRGIKARRMSGRMAVDLRRLGEISASVWFAPPDLLRGGVAGSPI
jgi:hypothetical protein